MDWLARPALRVTPSAAPPASWGTLATAAQAAAPDREVRAIFRPPHAWFAVEAIAENGKLRQERRIYLDPWTGAVRGTAPWLSFQRFFREMHRHLLLPANIGIPIVCSLSLLLLASLVTGLVTYRKFWRGFFRKPHIGSLRRLSGDLHRLGGLWSLWFVALIGLTGLWYLVEVLGADAPTGQAPKLEAAPPSLTAARIDQLATRAGAVFPGLDIRELRLPHGKQHAIAFLGQSDALLVRDRANGVWLDPADGRVLRIERGADLTVHQRISEMADPLHFGTWGGMATKFVWFVFGLILTGLAVTGAMIYSLRLAGARGAAEHALARRHWAGRLWHGMGAWGYAAAALFLLSLALIPGWFQS